MTWGNEVVLADLSGITISCDEPNLVYVGGSNLFATIRSSASLTWIVRSSDNGVTWSTPVIAFQSISKCDVAKIGGTWLFTYRCATDINNYPHCYRTSTDTGTTFSAEGRVNSIGYESFYDSVVPYTTNLALDFMATGGFSYSNTFLYLRWCGIGTAPDGNALGPVDFLASNDQTRAQLSGYVANSSGSATNLTLLGTTTASTLTAAAISTANGITFTNGMFANFMDYGANSVASGGASTNGSGNTANGYLALNGSPGNNNTANGYLALYASPGNNSTANGFAALYASPGGQNTANGMYAIYTSPGNYNTGLGYQAGRFLADGTDGNTNSTGALFLGANTRGLTNNTTAEVVIGYQAVGHGSHTVTLGDTNNVAVYANGTLTVSGSINQTNAAVTNVLAGTLNVPTITGVTSLSLIDGYIIDAHQGWYISLGGPYNGRPREELYYGNGGQAFSDYDGTNRVLSATIGCDGLKVGVPTIISNTLTAAAISFASSPTNYITAIGTDLVWIVGSTTNKITVGAYP